MPPLERTDLLDAAVFWPPKGGGKPDAYGALVVGSPVEIPCRWTDQQARALDPQGNTITVDATVVVDDDIEQFAPDPPSPSQAWRWIIGGILWRGGLYDLPGTGVAESRVPTSGVYVIKTYNATSDIKGREYRRTVGLFRFMESMPQVSP
jgi:hypothetical protein